MATHHHPLVDPSERSLIRPRLDRLIQSDKYRIDIGSEEGDHLKDVGAGVGRGRLWPCGHPVVSIRPSAVARVLANDWHENRWTGPPRCEALGGNVSQDVLPAAK